MAKAPQWEVGQSGCLLRGCLGKLAPSVTNLHGEQPRQSVEQPMTVLIEDVVALTAGDDGHWLGLKPVELREVSPQMAPSSLL